MLTESTPWSGVQQWLSQVLEDKSIYSQVVEVLSQTQPDGEIILSSTVQELQQELHLPFPLAKKIANRAERVRRHNASQGMAATPGGVLLPAPGLPGTSAKRTAMEVVTDENGSGSGKRPRNLHTRFAQQNSNSPSSPSGSNKSDKENGLGANADANIQRDTQPGTENPRKGSNSRQRVLMEVDENVLQAHESAANKRAKKGSRTPAATPAADADGPATGSGHRTARKTAVAARATFTRVAAAELNRQDEDDEEMEDQPGQYTRRSSRQAARRASASVAKIAAAETAEESESESQGSEDEVHFAAESSDLNLTSSGEDANAVHGNGNDHAMDVVADQHADGVVASPAAGVEREADGRDEDNRQHSESPWADAAAVAVKREPQAAAAVRASAPVRRNRRSADEDSDYVPSPRAGNTSIARAVNGRRRARGSLREDVDSYEAGSESDDSDMEDADVDVEVLADDTFLLPRADNQALPGYTMKYASWAGVAGMRLLLEGLDLEECVHLAEVLELPAGEMRTYMGTKKDKITGEVSHVERKRTVTQWRKELHNRICNDYHGVIDVFSSEHEVKIMLTTMQADEDCQAYMHRYLNSCFRVFPEIKEDNSNLAEVMMKLWSVAEQDPPPKNALLGTRTIHVVDMKSNFKKTGNVETLYKALYGYIKDDPNQPNGQKDYPPTIKISQRKHKGNAARQAIKVWLEELLRAPNSVSGTYKTYVENQEHFVKVEVYLNTMEVMCDALEEANRDTDPAAGPLPAYVPCDLLKVYEGTDHVMAALASQQTPHQDESKQASHDMLLKHLNRAKELMMDYNQVVNELVQLGVEEQGNGPDNTLNVGQMEKLLQYIEGQEYEEPENAANILKKLRLKLKPYQKQALNAIMMEEQSSASGRHLFVELSLPAQPKYDVEEVRRERREIREERELNRRARRGEASEDDSDTDEDEDAMDYDESDGGSNSVDDDDDGSDEEMSQEGVYGVKAEPTTERKMGAVGPSKQGTHEGRATTRSRRVRDSDRPAAMQSHARQLQMAGASAAADAGCLIPRLVKEAEEAAPGIRPIIRLFYSPALNCFTWGTSLQTMSSKVTKENRVGSDEGRRLGLSIKRGIMLCLEVGMGKTAVALAAALQSLRTSLQHAGRQIDAGEWSDELLYDGYDGYCGHLHLGGTLVISPKTLLSQWEMIEITKFLGKRFHEHVVNSCGVQGKKKPSTPADLAQYKLVMLNPEMVAQKNNMSLYKSVMWERIIVDEAHQEPGLLEAIEKLPHRSLIMLTGTPVVAKPDDIAAMFRALRLPNYTVVAKNASQMAYALRSSMVRYTNAGTQLTGDANLKLPPKTYRDLIVPWQPEEKKMYKRLEGLCKAEMMEYYNKTMEEAEVREARLAANRPYKGKKDAWVVQPLKLIHYARPLRHACSGYAQHNPSRNDDSDEDQDEEEEEKFTFKSKIQFLLAQIKEVQQKEAAEGKPVPKICIFSCFGDTLEAIKQQLGPEGFNFRTIATNMSMKKRSEALDAFMNDPPTTIFLLNAQLASVGLTLVAASHIFLMEPSFNPAQELQAVGRIHRMGQKSPVTLTRLFMKDSIEIRMMDLLAARANEQRSAELCAPANTKVKTSGKTKNNGENVAGVCASAKTEELLKLFGTA